MLDPTSLKLARLALDRATPEPEALSAFNALRKTSYQWVELAKALVEDSKTQRQHIRENQSERIYRPANGSGPTMPFGKYRGVPLSSLARDHPDYLEWVLDNCQRLSPQTRNQIGAALNLV